MARAKVILVDADVISHFIATDHIYELNEILSPHQLYIVDNVYKEATYHPSDKERKNKIDEWLKKSKACSVTINFLVMARAHVWRWLVLSKRQLQVATSVM